MLAMSPLCPNLGWEYPMDIGTQQSINLENDWNLDYYNSLVIPNFSTSQKNQVNYDNNNNNNNNNYQVYDDDQVNQGIVKRSSDQSSPRSVSSSREDECGGNVLVNKKLNHNASERDRRKKINYLYSTLRSLLPPNNHTKKLSIPNTVGQVLKYIPELQKEVDALIQRKDDLLSKFSILQGPSDFIQEQKPKLKDQDGLKIKHSCSISTSKLGDKEIMIQISSLDNISLPELIHKLEMDNNLQILDVSSFRTFGGSIFYNVHLWNDGMYTMNCNKLNEEVTLFIQKQNMSHSYY